MRNKMFTAFLGGLFGILAGGYMFRLTGEHNFLIVPLGTFIGCLIGFVFPNRKTILSVTRCIITAIHVGTINGATHLTAWTKIRLASLQPIRFPKPKFIFFQNVWKIFKRAWGYIKNLVTKICSWAKNHPMNRYMIMEIVTAVAVLAISGYLIFHYQLFVAGDDQHVGPQLVYLLKGGIVLAWVIAAAIVTFVLSIQTNRPQRLFYADWQFYNKYGIAGILIKTTTKIASSFIFAYLVCVSLIFLILLAIAYGLFMLIFSLILMATVSIVTYVFKLMRDKKELATLVIAMIITTISYFLYRDRFADQIILWAVAFATGSASALSTGVLLSIRNGWLINGLEKIRIFINSDEADPEKPATYYQSWTGVVAMAPGRAVIKGTSVTFDHLYNMLFWHIPLKMR